MVTVTETVCTPGPGTGPSKPTSPAPGQTTAPGPSGTSAPCSSNLVSGNFEFPHLIVPIDSSSPDTGRGTQYNAVVTSTISTIFNFDIPASDAGKTCSLVFHFPEQKDLQTSSFNFTGDGKVEFAELSSPATQSTTFNSAPSVKTDFGVTTIAPGNSYVISTFACPSGQAIAFEIKEAGTTALTFFEDYNPSPYVFRRISYFLDTFTDSLLGSGFSLPLAKPDPASRPAQFLFKPNYIKSHLIRC